MSTITMTTMIEEPFHSALRIRVDNNKNKGSNQAQQLPLRFGVSQQPQISIKTTDTMNRLGRANIPRFGTSPCLCAWMCFFASPRRLN